VASSTYHFGYGCGDDAYSYVNNSADYPSRAWSPDWPIIDYSADFHVFGAEINDTAIAFYVDNSTNVFFTLTLPALCLSDPGFVWGKSAYMPFKPLYGILNVAVTPNANTTWWEVNHNTTTLVDWVRWFEFMPGVEEP